MKTIYLIFACTLIAGCASAPSLNLSSAGKSIDRTVASSPAFASLLATLSTGSVESLKMSITIKPSTSSEIWTVEKWHECPSYPCNAKDFMKSIDVRPQVIRDARAGDGDLEIKLNDEMTVLYKNPGPPMGDPVKKTDYFLLYGLDGQQLQIPIYLKAEILTHN